MNKFIIPTKFIFEHTSLTWSDAQYGFTHGWIGWKSIIEIAVERLTKVPVNHPLEIQLAGLRKEESWAVSELVEKLAQIESNINKEEVQKKWLCLILRWVYENQDGFADPLGVVEEIYAEFDYPKEIEGFIRYMPPKEDHFDQSYLAESNQQRLFRRWQEYLDNCQESLL